MAKPTKSASTKPLESVNDFIARARGNEKAYESATSMEWIIYTKLALAARANGDVSTEREAIATRYHNRRDYKALRKLNNSLAESYGDHVWTHANVAEASAPVTRSTGTKLEFPPSKPRKVEPLRLQCGCEIHKTKGVIGTELGMFSKARKQARG